MQFTLVVDVHKPMSLRGAVRALRTAFTPSRSPSEKFWSDVWSVREQRYGRFPDLRDVQVAVHKSPEFREFESQRPQFENWLEEKFPAELLQKIKAHYIAAGTRGDEAKDAELHKALEGLNVKFVRFQYGSLLQLLNFTGIESLASALGLSVNDFVREFADLLASFAPPMVAAQLGVPDESLSASATPMTASSSSQPQQPNALWAKYWWIGNTSLVLPVLLVMGTAYVAFVVMQEQLKQLGDERRAFVTGVQTQVTALGTERTDALAKILTTKLDEAKLVLEAQKQAATLLAQEFENRQKSISAERESLAKLQASLIDAQLQHIKESNAGAKAREAAGADLYKTILDRSKPPVSPPTPPETSCSGADDRLLAMKVQLALRERGLYSGSIDGYIGKGSRASLTAFQRSQGWPERDIRDKETLAKLKITC